jgi:elongation factor 3
MSRELSPLLPMLIPKATECIYDNKKQVQYAGIEALNDACNAISNEDIRPLVPQLVSVIAHPDEAIKTLDLLLETTFVATVDSPVLALIAPLLGKSLKPSQSTLMKRKASRVIDIMCRLVQNPTDVAPFMPLLLPALDKVIDEIVDAEVREVASAAREILLNAFNGKSAMAASTKLVSIALDFSTVQSNLLNALRHALPIDGFPPTILKYVSELTANLTIYGTAPNPNMPADCSPEHAWKYAVAMSTHAQWRDCILPYITPILKFYSKKIEIGEPEATPISGEFVATSFRTHALGNVRDNDLEDDSDAGNVCDIEFSLAFGGKILLHNTRLRLGKGRRYGLMGKNGAGKTTLLTNLGSGNIEGVPSYLKMVYVQHDDASDDFGVPLIDEVMASSDMKAAEVTREAVISALKAINFTDVMLSSPRSALSGGWKMKLLIVKAMLAKADVLLLDEVI